MKDPLIVLDVWEGQLECDEKEFHNGGVAGLNIRLNDTAGGLHKDQGFDKQWAEAESFVRVPYYVYTPWETGKANFEWLAKNMPTCPAVFPDTELAKAGYSQTTYGVEYNTFISLCQKEWKTIPYTGRGYSTLMNSWPKIDYWWSAWPWIMYPSQRISIGWTNLKIRLSLLSWPPFNAQYCPGTVRLWQCSGDRFIVPGSSRAMDVSVFPGTINDYRVLLGYDSPSGPPEPPTIPDNAYMINPPSPYVAINTRSGPGQAFEFKGTIAKGTSVLIIDSAYGYSKMSDGRWVFTAYISKQ
jgi:hypothetical protein